MSCVESLDDVMIIVVLTYSEYWHKVKGILTCLSRGKGIYFDKNYLSLRVFY
jgi:hypothetical protein